MMLSIVIPAYNEAESLPETVQVIYSELCSHGIKHEILVVNDNSKDNTLDILGDVSKEVSTLRWISNTTGANGFGMAVRMGLNNFHGDIVAIMMADLSDSPKDLVKYYNTLIEGNYDCVFGSRFIKGGKTIDYPIFKKFLNRFFNTIVRLMFGVRYNDMTNAFKIYKKDTVEGLKPFLSPHFNLTLELPLKAIVRGYTYTVVPNSWRNRKFGESKLKIREMGSRYFFILLYCLVEKYFSQNDFQKK
ncbi:glycosyltransferase family 2 protein [Bacteroidota bacterium]